MLVLDADGRQPLYERLYGQIRDKIVSGEWPAAMKLPSGRQLAADLRISRNTVDQAYQQLAAEGYLCSRPRSGYYVERLDTAAIKAAPPAASCGEAAASKVPESCRYDFRYGKLDPRYAPFKIWKHLMLACFGEEMDGIAAYGDPQGEYGLREQITKYVREYRGVICEPEQVVVGAGTLHCLGLLCNVLKPAASVVGFEDPGYGKTRDVFKNAGFRVRPIGVERDGIDVGELAASGATAVYVTPSHQFPTGHIMSIAKRTQLLEWAGANRAVIIEDDYACHFRYNVRPVPALQGLSPAAAVVYFGNFSKPLLPSLRLAFMVLPPALLAVYNTIHRHYNTAVPYLHQRTLERFMREGYWDRHLRRVLHVYKRKHDCLLKALGEHCGERVEVHGKNAGLFVTIRVNGDLREEQLIARAAALGVRVYPVSDHWERTELYDGQMLLLGYSSLEPDEIDQAVRLLRQAWFE